MDAPGGRQKATLSNKSRAPAWPERIQTRYSRTLAGYDWEPHQEVGGVELGWGKHELDYNYNLWAEYGGISDPQVLTRYGGRLDYAAFAVLHGVINGRTLTHAYIIGNQFGCYPSPLDDGGYESTLPPEGTQWPGAAVVVTPRGEIGHGPADFTLGETVVHEYENNLNKLYFTWVHVNAPTVYVDTGAPLYNLDFQVIFGKSDPFGHVTTSGKFLLYGHGCSELAGWQELAGSGHWAFGARLVEAMPME